MDGHYFGSEPGNIAPDVNWTPMRQVYLGADGGSIATAAAAGSPDSYGVQADPNAPAVDTPAVGAIGGVTWWVGIAIVLGLMLFTAKKTGQASEFSNVRISTYNVLFITLVAVLGLTALKVGAVKVRNVPLLKGFSDVVLAA